MERYLKQKEVLFFLLTPFFKPISFQYYSSLSMIENFWVVWKIAAAIVGICFLMIYAWNHNRISKLIIGIGVFEASILASTLFYQGDVTRALIDSVSVVSFVSILILSIQFNLKGMSKVLYNLMNTLMLLNLLSMILFPGGLNADLYVNEKINSLYFMVIDNGNALFLSFCIIVLLIHGIQEDNLRSAKNNFLIITIILSSFLSGSATAIFLVNLEIVLLVVALNCSWAKRLNPRILLFLYALFIPILFSLDDNRAVSFILENIFNRSADISGRYTLWEFAIGKIIRQPIFGYGRQAEEYIATWGGYFSSHNILLEVMLQGGVVAFSLLAIVVKMTIDKINEMRHQKLTICLMFILFVILIAALVESEVHSLYIFGCIVFCYYCKQLEPNIE